MSTTKTDIATEVGLSIDYFYNVNDIYPCIQGEGINAGVPMMLLRLQGCSVGCTFCDTKESWELLEENKQDSLHMESLGTNPKWASKTPFAIYLELLDQMLKARGIKKTAVDRSGNYRWWVLITGGEPAEQELYPLVYSLKTRGLRVAIETSGTAPGALRAARAGLFSWVCASPKLNNPNKKPFLGELVPFVDEFKFVVGRAADITRAEAFVEAYADGFKQGAVVSLQPVSNSLKAAELCTAAVMANGMEISANQHGREGIPWRLSIQTHKLLKQR